MNNRLIGQHVHYVLDKGPNTGKCRTALVVGGTEIYPNVTVFPDGQGDGVSRYEGGTYYVRGTIWKHGDDAAPASIHKESDVSACNKLEAKK